VLPLGHVMIQLSVGTALQAITVSMVVLTLEGNFKPVSCDEVGVHQGDIFSVVMIYV